MTVSPHQRTILIAGPTASGKSRLALRLAEELGGTIINADSMQVYRELRLLTARPAAAEEARAPHALYGFVPGAEAYSAGRYAADAAQAIAAARREGRIPIIVGGTGLYFTALLVNVGCHSDAHEQAKWFGDDIALKTTKYDYGIRGIRSLAAMKMLGRDTGDVRLPLTPLTSAEEQKLAATLGTYGLL